MRTTKTKTKKSTKKTRKPQTRSTGKDAQINKLVKVAKSQERVISSLLEVVKTGKSSAVVAERVPRRNKTTEVIATGRDSKEALDKEFKKYNYELFLEGLHKIGRPAMTKEIAERMRKDPKFKRITRNKKRFMQFLYSSVSHFVKQGVLKRKPIGEKSYEYSLTKSATKRLAAA